MKITVISSVYSPEPIISSKTSYQIAGSLQKRGNQVTVITSFPNRPAGIIYPGYHRHLYRREITAYGHKIIRCYSSLSPHSTLISRLLENLTFGITSSLAVLFSTKPDVIYANTWPIFAQGLTCIAAHLRGIPIVLTVQDIYPESLSFQGRLSEPHPLYKILKWLDRRISRSCQALIVISDRFAKIYCNDRGVPAYRVHVITNWVDPQEISLLPRDRFRTRFNIPMDAFVYVYGGNIGVAGGVEATIEAFSKVENDRIYLFIAGDGTNRTMCENLVTISGISNVIFHYPWLAEETSEVLAAADVLLLPTYGKQSLASVPSKLLSYLLAARPVLAAVLPESDTAQIIEKAGCGWIIPPANIDILARKIEELAGLPEQMLEEMGFAGRQYALQNFATETCLPKVIEIIENAAREGTR